MLNIYYVDFNPHGSSHGITSYTSQYLSKVSYCNAINLNCIWLNSPNLSEVIKKSDEGVRHYYIPKYNSAIHAKLTYGEWNADMIFNIITEKDPIIHVNWISHCDIFKYLRWRLDYKIVLTKHCIPWRDLITDDYLRFRQIDECYKKGTKLSSLSPTLISEQSTYNFLDHIITVTESAKKSLTTLFSYNRENVSLINNGIDFGKTFATSSDNSTVLRKSYGFQAGDKLILFVGALSVRKGVSDLIESFNLLLKETGSADTKLIVAGKGDYTLLFKYTNIISKIVITGTLPKEVLSDFYKMADIGVIPSYVEQCSYTAIEMMHAKLPVIASDIDGLNEVIKENCGTYISFEPYSTGTSFINVVELKDKINWAFNNHSTLIKKADRAYENALTQFSLSTMIEKTISVYKKVSSIENSRTSFLYRKDLPKLSILLPVYNGQKYIAECIESVLAQTYINFELIIINDASTDNTLSIINGFSDSRIKVINNKRNCGITYTLNRGLRYSKGDYIARIDADDKMLPNRLHEQVYFLENNQDFAMVGSWYEIIDKDGKHVSIAKPLTEHEDLKLLLLFANQFAHSTTMIRYSVLNILKYSNSYKHCEDYDLWLRISATHKVGNLPIVLSKYRVHNTNVSSLYNKQQLKNSVYLVADKLTDLKIDFTVDELKIHAAIMRRAGTNYFIYKNHLFNLSRWIDKILSSSIWENYDKEKKDDFKKFIISTYCFSDRY